MTSQTIILQMLRRERAKVWRLLVRVADNAALLDKHAETSGRLNQLETAITACERDFDASYGAILQVVATLKPMRLRKAAIESAQARTVIRRQATMGAA